MAVAGMVGAGGENVKALADTALCLHHDHKILAGTLSQLGLHSAAMEERIYQVERQSILQYSNSRAGNLQK